MKQKCLNFLEITIEYSLYAIIFFTPISKAAIEIFFTIAFISFCLKKSLRPDFKFLNNSLYFFLLLFITFGALSFINSGIHLAKSISALIFKWLEYIFLFIIVNDSFSTPKRVRNATFVFLSTALLLSIDGLFQRFCGVDFLRGKPLWINKAITASFQHYNDFGVYLVLVISLVTALIVSKKPKKMYRLILSLLNILLWICLLFTLSRGNWIAIIFALILMLFLSKRAKEVFYLLVLFVLVLSFLPGIKERFVFIFQYAGDQDRFIMWKTALAMIRERPFLGKGIGTFMANFHTYCWYLNVQYAHNCFLQIWAETGIFSLLSFLLFLTKFFSSAIKSFRKNQNPVILGLTCGLFAYLVSSFFDTNLYSLQLATLFWSIAGFTLAITKLEEQALLPTNKSNASV